MKGSLSRDLDNESRAGATDKNKPTHGLILDFDGITLENTELQLPLTGIDLEKFATLSIAKLPHISKIPPLLSKPAIV